MEQLMEIGKRAKLAAKAVGLAGADEKNRALAAIAEALTAHAAEIIEANRLDVDNARQRGVKESLVDRLVLDEKRIQGIADAIGELIELPDPIGEVLSMHKRPNGLLIGQKRVPMGVIGIIYEARPNVTVDAATLCLKAGSSVILRGGSDAIHSNTKLVSIMRQALKEASMPEDAICLIEDTDRKTATEMMKMKGYIDLLIPRGGAGLIQSVVENATVPVIETGTGNCHVYVDADADTAMAEAIIINAKTQRTGVCNAAESLLVHKDIAQAFLPGALKALQEKGVEIRGCERTAQYASSVLPATEEDYRTEFLDLILSVKVVDSLDEAIDHINEYSTGHSETIVTKSYDNANRFLEEVDSAAVYVNASTRFTDGGEFGFGAEMGISTQKLHARGPMGLKEITALKYIIYGNGQIR